VRPAAIGRKFRLSETDRQAKATTDARGVDIG